MGEMKTPEQLAVDWYIRLLTEQPAVAIKEAYQAGYQAAKDQLADADKVMNSPKKLDSWISVKERLPEKKDIDDIFLVWNAYDRDVSTVRWQPYGFDDVNDMYISHWMPLPEMPEDKGKAHWQELREFWKARNVTISEWQEEK